MSLPDVTLSCHCLMAQAALLWGGAAGGATDEHGDLTEQNLFCDLYTIALSFPWVAKQTLALFRANGQPKETTQHQVLSELLSAH